MMLPVRHLLKPQETMKRNYILIVLASALFAVHGCGPKAKESSTTSMSEGDSVANAQKSMDEAKATDKKIAREKARAERKKREEARKNAETYEVSGLTVYNHAAVKPQYKGGKDAMNKYFKDNLKYPADGNWQGTIVVDFVIGKDGKVEFADVTEDVDSVSDQIFREEAVRVVKNMPAWIAGRQNGKSVAASYTLPVTFQQF
jgi:TonB family protein